MAKKELTEKQKREKKLAKLSVAYTLADNELHIAGKPINEQIHILVNANPDIYLKNNGYDYVYSKDKPFP